MRFRFIRVFTLLALLAGAFAGVARALDFDDEDPEPVRAEVGEVVDYKMGSHAGCLPHRYVITNGELPPGLKLGQEGYQTMVVDGIPTEGGTWSVWIAVKDCDNKSAESLFTFEISHRSYAIKTTALPAATTGAPYSTKLLAGDHPVRSEKWELSKGSLPAGLALAADGTISGTPIVPGSSTFTVTATSNGDDGNIRIDSREFTLTVGGQIAVTASRSAAEVGIPFRATLGVTGGGSWQWSAPSGGPAGLTVSSDGVISGVPTLAGSYKVALHLAGTNGAATDVTLSLVVHPRLTIATRLLRGAVTDHAYRTKLAARGGVRPIRWTIARGLLPRGLTLGASTGTFTGAPAKAGTFRITLRARDSLGAVATKKLVLTVR